MLLPRPGLHISANRTMTLVGGSAVPPHPPTVCLPHPPAPRPQTAALPGLEPRAMTPASPPPPPHPEMDLVLRGGTIVTADGRSTVDVGIKGEAIAQIGGTMRGRREVLLDGAMVTPGGVDPHVHLTCSDSTPHEPAWVDDFESGSAAALAGGVTTIGNMSFVLPSEAVLTRLGLEAAQAEQQAMADVFLHPALLSPSPSAAAELSETARRGFTSLKFFMCFPSFDSFAAQFQLAMESAAAAGSITLIHCEDLATIECCVTRLSRENKRSLRHFAESRPVLAELVATQRAIAMCEATGAPTYIVHLSSARALEACVEARRRGLPLYVETRPLYLHHTSEHYHAHDGPLFVAQPPLRETTDREALWAGLADGSIDTLGSDHAPWTRDLKMDVALDVGNLRSGVAELDTMLPLFFTEGVLGGRLTPERFVAVTSTNAARLFGLYPRKGTIAVGSDADLVVWETRQQGRVIENQRLQSRAGHSVYEGQKVLAWPRLTIRRGEIVYEDGRVLAAPGSGRVLRRNRTEPLPLPPVATASSPPLPTRRS